MIKGFRRLIVSFSLYSVIPMPRISFDNDDMACSLMWFPLVGAVIGAGVFLVNGTALKEALPAAVRVMLTLLIPLVVTGGIHLDGFMDTEDALHSYASKEKKLEILKDPHIGAFAVIGLVRTGLILAAAVTMILISKKSSSEAVLLLASVFVTGRALSGLTSLHFKKARDEGMLCKETKGSSSLVYFCLYLQLLLSAVFTLFLDVKRGALVLAAFALYTVYYRYDTCRSFGGVTGDTAGHYLVQSETAAAAVLALTMLH